MACHSPFGLSFFFTPAVSHMARDFASLRKTKLTHYGIAEQSTFSVIDRRLSSRFAVNAYRVAMSGRQGVRKWSLGWPERLP